MGMNEFAKELEHFNMRDYENLSAEYLVEIFGSKVKHDYQIVTARPLIGWEMYCDLLAETYYAERYQDMLEILMIAIVDYEMCKAKGLTMPDTKVEV